MERKRAPGYITQKKSTDFGAIPVKVRGTIPSGSNPGLYPSGDPVPDGQNGLGDQNMNTNFRDPIPPGKIGSRETNDIDAMGPPQYVDTVADYHGAQNDVNLHDPLNAVRSGGRTGVPFQDYALFTPRSAPMPRAAQDETFLRGAGKNLADPRMIDRDSTRTSISDRNVDIIDLYGMNVDGTVSADVNETVNDSRLTRPK